MTTHNISVPLNIEGLRVLGTEITENGTIIIDVESEEKGTHCHRCGQFVQKFHGRDRPILLRHLPILDQVVYLRMRPSRWRCDECDNHPTTTQTCDWYQPNATHTKAFEHFILRELVNSTVVDVSLKQTIGQDAILGIVDRHIPVEPNWDGLKNSRELGIDEISLKKGHQDYVTVISSKNDQDEVNIITVLEDRKKATVKEFLESIPADLKPQIHHVCSDMYEGFINAAYEALPDADVVIDRFHVAKDYRGCADLVRKRELKRLKQELSQEEYQQIQQTMWPFRKAWEDLNEDERQRLNLLFSYSTELKQAYFFRDLLTQIFEKNIDKSKALAYFNDWQELVENSGLAEFKPFLATLKRWRNEISNYFLDRESSGFVEGLNNKIKVLKRRCYGIFNLDHLRQRLRLDLEGYGLFGHREQVLVEC